MYGESPEKGNGDVFAPQHIPVILSIAQQQQCTQSVYFVFRQQRNYATRVAKCINNRKKERTKNKKPQLERQGGKVDPIGKETLLHLLDLHSSIKFLSSQMNEARSFFFFFFFFKGVALAGHCAIASDDKINIVTSALSKFDISLYVRRPGSL